MNDKKFGAIKLQVNLGKRLRKEHPEIAQMYEKDTYQQIAEQLRISEEYSLKEGDFSRAIGFAIAGFKGGFGIESYEGLLSKKELKRIKKEHNRNARFREDGTYICGNLEAIAEGGRRGAITRGQVPWVLKSKDCLSEKQRAYELSKLGNSHLEILTILNDEYHEGKKVRTKSSINGAMFMYRKTF